jgi:hypothetical protein
MADSDQINPVLSGSRWVLEQPTFSEHVQVLDVPVEVGALRRSFRLPNWEFFIPADLSPKQALSLILTGNAINAAYTHRRTGHRYRRGALVGSAAMWEALLNGVKNGRAYLDGPGLVSLTLADMRSIFVGNPQLPNLPSRLAHLHNIGEVLIEKYDGSFMNLLEESQRHLFGRGGLVTRLTTQFDAYSDLYVTKSPLEEKAIEFNKRAQLAAGALVGWIGNRVVPRSMSIPRDEVAKLTVYADYVLPMIQMQRGKVGFSHSLSQAIREREVLCDDDPRVIAFRAATVISCAQDVVEINKFRSAMGETSVIAAEYDAYLWLEFHKQIGPHPIVDTLRF